MDYSLYVYEKKRKKEKLKINFKFSGESKGGQMNKVFEKLRNQKKGIPVN